MRVKPPLFLFPNRACKISPQAPWAPRQPHVPASTQTRADHKMGQGELSIKSATGIPKGASPTGPVCQQAEFSYVADRLKPLL